MTFQIISKKTNQPIKLSEFDHMYCQFNNQKEDENYYAIWYPWLEGVFRTFADIHDNCKDSRIYHQVVGKDKSYMMTPLQVVQCLLIWEGRTYTAQCSFDYYKSDIEVISEMVKFYLSEDIIDDYYFIFHG